MYLPNSHNSRINEKRNVAFSCKTESDCVSVAASQQGYSQHGRASKCLNQGYVTTCNICFNGVKQLKGHAQGCAIFSAILQSAQN